MPKLSEYLTEEAKEKLEKLAQKLKRAEAKKVDAKCNESQPGNDHNGKKGKRGEEITVNWSSGLVKYRLHYWENYKEYVRMYRPTIEYIGVPKRKRSTFMPWWIPAAEENAMFEECFSKLTDQEQQFLTTLYPPEPLNDEVASEMGSMVDLSVDDDIRIEYSQAGFDSLMKTGLSPKEIWDIVNGALAQLTDWLNKLEQIIV